MGQKGKGREATLEYREHGISDVRLSFSRRSREVAMNLGLCCGSIGQGEWAEDIGIQRLFSRYVLALAPSPARIYRSATQETGAA